MLSQVQSMGILGIEGFSVCAQVYLTDGLPSFDIVGLPGAAVRESKERVRAALKNSGFAFPPQRITVNLAPADIKKESPAFDLPIALGILAASGQIPQEALSGLIAFGELSLKGDLAPVRGALSLLIAAREQNCPRALIPEGSAHEGRCVEGIEVLPVRTLAECADHLTGKAKIAPLERVPYASVRQRAQHAMDLTQVRGQRGAKRALEIAAAGGHNLLMIGPPGSGKTMLARCLPSILPDMTFEEALESTRIHSVAGAAPEEGLLTERPFRTPHHTASHVALVGGGMNAAPGEVSKAHNGVLFLDELPEYQRLALEAMRQPIEDGAITVTRIGAQIRYPARFMLVCSMNPCPCGHHGSRSQSCRCTPNEIRRYLSRISGPLLDRIDLHIEVESIPVRDIAQFAPEERSEAVRERVNAAREIQRRRYQGENIHANDQLDAKRLNVYCKLSHSAKDLLVRASEQMELSSRAYTRMLKVSRTIADLAGAEDIGVEHVAEAVQYRVLDRKYWG